MKFSHQVRATLLEIIENNLGSNPSRIIQQQFPIMRETVRREIQKLINDKSIVAEEYAKGRVYFPSKHYRAICGSAQMRFRFLGGMAF